MCKNDDYIKETSTYISTMLNENVLFKPVDKVLRERLPMSIAGNFTLYAGKILEQEVLIACIQDGNQFPPAQMQKQLDIIRRITSRIVILVPMEIASYNISRLIAQKVNFIIPCKQMFIPTLLLELKRDKNVGGDLPTVIPPIAQCLLLYHLEVDSINGKDTESLAKNLGVSYATINRALRWLSAEGIIGMGGGKTKTVEITLENKALWEKALPLLVSPVGQTVYTDALLDRQTESGMNALSSYTMINGDDKHCYAMTKETLKSLDITYNRTFGEHEIQIWRYDPRLLSQTGTADKLSLYLSLKENDDERVQIELERLINEIQW